MKGVQNTFRNQVNAVCSIIEEMENTFADQTGDLFVLDTRDSADSKVVETVRTVEQLGKDQYQQFVTKKLRERTTPLFDTIQKNKLPLFSSPPATKEKSSDKLKIASLKSNCSLFHVFTFHVRSGMVIWKDSLVTRTRVFPFVISVWEAQIWYQIGFVILTREEWTSASIKAFC